MDKEFKCDAVGQEVISHLDSLEPGLGVFFQRQLEVVNPRILMVKRPPRTGLTLFPIDTSIPLGPVAVTDRMYETMGKAAIIGDYSKDLPRVDLAGKEQTRPLKDLGASYGWNFREIEAARHAGMDLNPLKGLAARDAIELQLNRIVWLGAPEVGLYGVLTHPAVPRYQMPNAITTNNADTLIADICDAINAVADGTEEVEAPNRVIMAPRLKRSLLKRYRANTDSSILDMVVKGQQYVAKEGFVEARELAGAGPNGEDLMIVDRRDELVMSHRLVQPFTQLPAERRGMEYVIACVSRTGGMFSAYPMAMRVCVWPK